jgi:alkylresorcinol/alkylpyrone synthase
VTDRARVLFRERGEDIERLLPVYANAGIETRYSCVPIAWYEQDHGWAEKNRLFLDNALLLLEQATRACLKEARLRPQDIDAIVCVSTSGIATPSLDARLMERLKLKRDVTRLPIFGLGCAGGVLGLSRAAGLARTMPGAHVLFLVVELCGLTFRRADQSKSNVIATALFGDGAAAALIVADPPAALGTSRGGHRIVASGEHTWSDSLDVMGWHVEDDGLGVLFSKDIPSLIRGEFGVVLDGFLDKTGFERGDIDHFLCHPGGTKVLDALEDVIDRGAGSLDHSRAVLRDFGNMSAATVVFVLDRFLRAGGGGRSLLTAVGPGFTAGFLILDGT